ncbi:response regulator transcription factor [Rhodococcus sp. LB1]|uniref:response regulator transcription factor n=1 Tax=Rhodococcus sp. LB1 TaxID=1807499 RepID=UPI00077ACFE1|nr:helix-turn-helix transcriptional regulator [Rhodococcus sp. LB1]KXX60409.1 LuxR family transcriptional regulator [Rhodococcus sp. LB1]
MTGKTGRAAVRSTSDRELSHAVMVLLDRLRDDYGVGPRAHEIRGVSLGTQMALLDEATESALATLPKLGSEQQRALGRVIVDLQNTRMRIRMAHAGPGHIVQPSEFASAIRRLRGSESVAGLRKRICVEAASAAGLDRILLSEVHNGTWTALELHSATGSGEALSSLQALPLGFESAESRASEARCPILAGPDSDIRPSYEALQMLATNSYVVAPITLSTGVIGLVHGCRSSGDPADVVVRDVLGAYARSFGTLFERAMLADHLSEQKNLIVQRLQQEAREAELLEHADVSFVDENSAEQVSALPGTSHDDLNPVALASLTTREREVFRLLVRGASNAEIADELVISIFTVKTHVKKILRKLGAMNRSEAIYRYLEMTDQR